MPQPDTRDHSSSPEPGIQLLHNLVFRLQCIRSNSVDSTFPPQRLDARISHPACYCPHAAKMAYAGLHGNVRFQLGWTRSYVQFLLLARSLSRTIQTDVSISPTAMTGLNIYLGATLADFSPQISSSSHTQTPNILVRLIPWILLLLGLHLSGYPEKSPEWTSWSQQLASIGHWIFPTGAEYWRFWPSIGAQLMTVAALLSPSLQKFLSHPALIWLGSLSFPLYLLHGPLIRSVLSWMLFGWRNPIYYYTKNFDGSVASTWERIPFPDNWVFCIALPAFFFVLLASAHFWTLLVEPRCAKITKLMEEVMYGESELSMEKTLRARSDSFLNGRSRSGSLLNGHSGNDSVMSSV